MHCLLCAHQCHIPPGKRGICRTRENRDGSLYALGYGNLIALANDSMEKKPLFHFFPASRTLSIAAVGCNFACHFCQNHTISQASPSLENQNEEWTPSALVALAKRLGAHSLSYTYGEPTVFFDFALETARQAAAAGYKNIFVTNGYLSSKALDTVAPFLDAANVDLKSFSNEFYQKYCGARLPPVLACLRELKERGIWVEITTLLIPSLNDSDAEIMNIASFIADLDKDIPWHISRFFPRHRLTTLPATPIATISRAVAIGKEKGLHFVYGGNIAVSEDSHLKMENTLCPSCGSLLIERQGFVVTKNIISAQGRCPYCRFAPAGIWSDCASPSFAPQNPNGNTKTGEEI